MPTALCTAPTVATAVVHHRAVNHTARAGRKTLRRQNVACAAEDRSRHNGDGEKLPLWQQIHKSVDRASDGSFAAVVEEPQVSQTIQSDVSAAPAPLWANVHTKGKQQPMWLRVSSGRKDSSDGPVAIPVAPTDEDSAPSSRPVEAGLAPLWQTVHKNKKNVQPFFWRIATRVNPDWDNAPEASVVMGHESRAAGGPSSSSSTASSSSLPTSTSPAAAVVGSHEPDVADSGVRRLSLPEETGGPVLVDAEALKAVSSQQPPPLWQQVHERRKLSAVIIGGAKTTNLSEKNSKGRRQNGQQLAEEEEDWTAPLASMAFGISIILLVEFVARAPLPPAA